MQNVLSNRFYSVPVFCYVIFTLIIRQDSLVSLDTDYLALERWVQISLGNKKLTTIFYHLPSIIVKMIESGV